LPIRSRDTITARKFPWLWIGAEITPGNFISVTENINSEVEIGTVVNVEFLESVTKLTDVISWKYLDAQTLKERRIPSNWYSNTGMIPESSEIKKD
jgi:hypothetical protein